MIALLPMIILTAIIAFISVSIVVLNISSRMTAFNLSASEENFIIVEGCAEEALIQLARDEAYSGGSYTVDDVSCAVVVTGADATRTLSVSGSKGDFTRDITLDVQLTPVFGIMEWDE